MKTILAMVSRVLVCLFSLQGQDGISRTGNGLETLPHPGMHNIGLFASTYDVLWTQTALCITHMHQRQPTTTFAAGHDYAHAGTHLVLEKDVDITR